MSNDPLINTASLKVGDVCTVAVELRDKHSGEPYWWKRFVVVTAVGRRASRHFDALTLKLKPDLDKDLRTIDLSSGREIVVRVPEHQWPQGVIAMRMALLMKRVITLEE